MNRLTFKEYFESKQRLLENVATTVKFSTSHNVYKYCKVPFMLSEGKTYVSFRPNDTIIIEWERTGEVIKPLQFFISETLYIPVWNAEKMKSWVEQSTIQVLEKL